MKGTAYPELLHHLYLLMFRQHKLHHKSRLSPDSASSRFDWRFKLSLALRLGAAIYWSRSQIRKWQNYSLNNIIITASLVIFGQNLFYAGRQNNGGELDSTTISAFSAPQQNFSSNRSIAAVALY